MKENQDILDIVFAGRNKSYGAYELRRIYPKHVQKAIIAGSLILVLLFMIPFISSLLKKWEKPEVTMREVTELEQPPSIDVEKPPPPPVEPPPPPVKPSIKFVPPVIKKDEEVIEEEIPPKVEELKEIDPGTKTVEGDPNAVETIEEPVEIKGTGEVAPVVVEKPKEPEIFTFVEQQPEFPGGVQEMYKYLYKNIKYPPIAKENNVSGRVTVRFVVNETGKVSNVEVLKGIGAGCDEEAKRVIASMPPWKPGKQNGRAVKVYYTVPVVFKLE